MPGKALQPSCSCPIESKLKLSATARKIRRRRCREFAEKTQRVEQLSILCAISATSLRPPAAIDDLLLDAQVKIAPVTFERRLHGSLGNAR
jgi:hypothetical protein